jgi:hypothetical protein
MRAPIPLIILYDWDLPPARGSGKLKTIKFNFFSQKNWNVSLKNQSTFILIGAKNLAKNLKKHFLENFKQLGKHHAKAYFIYNLVIAFYRQSSS